MDLSNMTQRKNSSKTLEINQSALSIIN